MLSASISNAEEIAAWIEEVRNKECRVVMKTERPVELRLGFMHPQYGVIPLSDKKGHLSPEVAHYYGSMPLDDSSTRVKHYRAGGGERGERRGRGVRSGSGRTSRPGAGRRRR
jgi:superfamily II RNA helicase